MEAAHGRRIRMADRWLKLFERLLESAVFQDESPALLKVFIWCLLRANFKDGKWRGQTIKRGQFVTGRDIGSEETFLPPSTWYKSLHRLEKMGCVLVEANNKWTTITVCNYERYQNGKSIGEQRNNSRGTTREQRNNNEITTGEQAGNTNIEEIQSLEGRKNGASLVRALDSGFSEPPESLNPVNDFGARADYQKAEFDDFWRAYPRRVGKEAAAKSFLKAVDRVSSREACTKAEAAGRITDAAIAFAGSAKAQGDFCPYPATWLNQGRFDDDQAEWDRLPMTAADHAMDAASTYVHEAKQRMAKHD